MANGDDGGRKGPGDDEAGAAAARAITEHWTPFGANGPPGGPSTGIDEGEPPMQPERPFGSEDLVHAVQRLIGDKRIDDAVALIESFVAARDDAAPHESDRENILNVVQTIAAFSRLGKAVEALLAYGEPREAAKLLAEHGKPVRAARVLDAHGYHSDAIDLLIGEGYHSEAVALELAGGDVRAAADLLINLDKLTEAVDLYLARSMPRLAWEHTCKWRSEWLLKKARIRFHGDMESAKEACNDVLVGLYPTFIRISTRGEPVGNIDALLTWMLTCTVNKMLRESRARSMRPFEKIDEMEDVDARMRYKQFEHRHDLLRVIASLNPNEQSAFHLRFFEQLTWSDIATKLGVPLGTAYAWYRRALEKLRNHWNDGKR